ncbi:MAG: metal-dependent hydrolase [Gemmatimonadetes bacterium]|nr:metal-dependent hydrolase [Gemmatimonadota bacterium]
MDNVSHSLAGWALARAAGSRRPAGTTLALVLASNLPDIDIVLLARSDPTYLFHHRGVTHSLLGLAVLSPVLALGLWWGYGRRTGLAWFCLLAYCGVALHILYDLVTSWGTMLLYPFSLTRFALEWLFIVDPVTWALPCLAVLAAWRFPNRARAAAVLFLALLAAYGAASGFLHARARQEVARAESAAERPAAEVAAFPLFGAPLRWNGLATAPARAPEPRIARYAVTGIPPAARLVNRLDRGFENRWAARALATRAGQGYLWWARVPVARVGTAPGPSGDPARVVVLQDLRYSATVIPTVETWTPFALRFHFDSESGRLRGVEW